MSFMLVTFERKTVSLVSGAVLIAVFLVSPGDAWADVKGDAIAANSAHPAMIETPIRVPRKVMFRLPKCCSERPLAADRAAALLIQQDAETKNSLEHRTRVGFACLRECPLLWFMGTISAS
ncbi:MAG TPA: hypothetical protein VGL22_09805 [Terracidiphilus sp.]|jgi:hypothetical protein